MTGGPAPGDQNLGEWLAGGGDDADIAICTRVRFARNVRGFRFATTMTDDDAAQLLAYLEERIEELDEDLEVQAITVLDDLQRRLLLERHLISREMALGDRARGVAVDAGESVSIMLNEEDHIRAQVFASGNSISEGYQRAERLDEQLMRRIPIAFSEEFGFLTSCPTNTGTGLRVSVMLHLPGLVWADDIEKATNAAQKINMAVRGLYGEGSRATGDFYQVSNQVTLGCSEDQILTDVGAAVDRLISWEREVREALLRGDSEARTTDRIFRALGTLERARILSTEEALTCLSAVRLGVQQGLIPDVEMSALNTALLLSQPAHLQRIAKTSLSSSERDVRRAELIRQLIGAS